MESKMPVQMRQIEAARKVSRHFWWLGSKPESERHFQSSIAEFGKEAGGEISPGQAERVAFELVVKENAVPSLRRHPSSEGSGMKVNNACTHMLMGTLLLAGAANILRIGGLALENSAFVGGLGLAGAVLMVQGAINLGARA